MVKILFVCLGNICRSPLAEGAFTHLVKQAGLEHRFACDSAGTSGYHTGELPDPRARKVAQQKGITLPSRARQLHRGDFYAYDYILAMDKSNLHNIIALKQRVAPDSNAHIMLMREFDPVKDANQEVEDPYYGDMEDFENCFTTVYRTAEALLDYLQKNP
ncbi:MAG: low molecular weight protein-tyrosine-phosphatase [Cytophagales bacterium]|nr:low molecular weight phosphotyrosine protein phosphatase [Bernardetiaceae bacterium]MDW8205467.1 low molecular weight protein-tyrosine-phosphatase [Cytophagales bacterium]